MRVFKKKIFPSMGSFLLSLLDKGRSETPKIFRKRRFLHRTLRDNRRSPSPSLGVEIQIFFLHAPTLSPIEERKAPEIFTGISRNPHSNEENPQNSSGM